MFSGKTTRMLLDVEKHRHAGREIHAFKPAVDDRYSSDEIVTHAGWSVPAIRVVDGAGIEERMLDEATDLKNSLVVVDELFMIPGASSTLIWLFRQGLDVVAASLDMSYACEPFEEVQAVLPWATRVEKCPSACTVCGEDAFYTHRKATDDDRAIVVGGKDLYEPRCRIHHPYAVKDV